MESFSIKYWAEDDRPREKLSLKGKSVLSDAELLAILIGSGSKEESAVQLCKRILASVNNNLNALGKLSISQLCEFKGIGEAKAISIIAALEMGRRRKIEDVPEISKITSSGAIFSIMHPLIGELAHEEFWVLFLNNTMRLLYKSQLSKGGISGTVVDLRIIFKTAFENNATSIILVHNHPSGGLKPSEADIAVTKKIRVAAATLDVLVLDHVIVSEQGYFSFKDEGLI